jgi:hypothetical protein
MARKKTTRTKRRRKAGVKIAHTAAFELCEDGTCGEVKGTQSLSQKIWCKNEDSCSKGGGYCQLFRRAKKAAEKDPWLVAPVDRDHEAKHEPETFDYKCLCVVPVLETRDPKDSTKTRRLQLCGTGACSLKRQKHDSGDTWLCSGKCENEKCKCTLFKLNMTLDPGKAKWLLMSEDGKEVPHENSQYYRCFCVK